MSKRIVGSADYNRKDNRITEPVIVVVIEGERYPTLDWGLGGFRVANYNGSIKPGQDFFVEGIGPMDQEPFAVRVDCEAVRVMDGQLAAHFLELSSFAYDVLEALMMRRQRMIDKLRERAARG